MKGSRRDKHGHWQRGTQSIAAGSVRAPDGRSLAMLVERGWLTSRQAAHVTERDRRRQAFTSRVRVGESPAILRSVSAIRRLLENPSLDAETRAGLHQGRVTDLDDTGRVEAKEMSSESARVNESVGGQSTSRVVFGARRRPGILSDRELAERTGYSQGHVSFLMAGKRNPSLECLSRIAIAMECSLDEAHQYIQERIRTRWTNQPKLRPTTTKRPPQPKQPKREDPPVPDELPNPRRKLQLGAAVLAEGELELEGEEEEEA